ncbi:MULTISPECIES: transposase DNA-binding-containing protein [Cupriavidus]|uniref:transposase DNA-binding-containing protein n=1 Tax=Cupriavidus TaxID=106589 RepID=UPI0020C73139|nr:MULTISPECIES: transposase DNA-binding-containing protein [Cupriavidus]
MTEATTRLTRAACSAPAQYCSRFRQLLDGPGACGGWSATIAAYRFFRNEEIEWTDVMRPHWSALWPGRVDIWRW